MRSTATSSSGDGAARPRVLVFAYAAEPDRGSETGAGWGLVQAVAEFADCVVLVGPEHGAGVRRWRNGHADARVTFVEVPERRPRRAARRHRIAWFALYLAWLRDAARVGRRLHAREPFDAVFHATYSTYWLPTPATSFGVPCVWGPVGGAVTTPFRLWPLLGWRGIVDEVIDLAAVRFAACWPATRRSWRDATCRLVQNEETLARFPAELRRTARVLNHVMFVEGEPAPASRHRRHALYVSPLESRKGPRLALQALATTPPDVRLVLVGDGPQREELERFAARRGLAARVEFLGRVPRSRVFELLAEAAVVVFTGLREEGGMALAEAMLAGAPVIVLAHGGARTVASAASDASRVVLVPATNVDSTARAIGEAMTRFCRNPVEAEGPNLDPAPARRALRESFDEALGRARRSPAAGVTRV